MSTNSNLPAYPQPVGEFPANGLTKREAFIMAAMQGLLSNESVMQSASNAANASPEAAAQILSAIAVIHADAALADAEKTTKP